MAAATVAHDWICIMADKKKKKLMELLDFIQSETDIKNLNVVLTDLNGIFRVRNYLSSQINKIQNGHFRMPISVLNLDIWGNDIENSKWVFETGDADGEGFWTHKKPLLIKSVSPNNAYNSSINA